MADYYTSIRNIPVWNFYEILNSGTLAHLFKDEPDPKVTVPEMQEVWNNIYNEYCKAAKVDNRHFRQIAKVEELKLKYQRIALLIEMTDDRFTEVRTAAKLALKELGYVFNPDKPFEEELKRLRNELNILKTKISIETGKLPTEEKHKANAMEQATVLEDILEGRREIDIYTITVEKWLAINDLAKKRIEARKKNK